MVLFFIFSNKFGIHTCEGVRQTMTLLILFVFSRKSGFKFGVRVVAYGIVRGRAAVSGGYR